ncbi:MAG TPA: PIG-L deacetylase family protein [Xanthobacteraceae bacterium]|nr:PIG-L deacetylase family protein [Xanthobacteraceae bacterium]
MAGKNFIVISAHVGDFVWRAGGAIALHARLGLKPTVVCLSYGAIGESAKLYEDPAMTAAKARDIRRSEAEQAAKVLGADIHFLDAEDYPLRPTPEMFEKTVRLLRETQPEFIMTHPRVDPSNWDHVETFRFATEARQVAQAQGRPWGKIAGGPQVYCFEPHQPELCEYTPDTYLDISEVWDQKWSAMQCLKGQTSLWNYYKGVAEKNGNLARRRNFGTAQYAESFQRVFPATVKRLDPV